ncbi:molybdopterin-guanine dinucleotide biosynthesis protein B [Metaclostridioides mangenotii]|uniref:molybdopterin-guanine dinucleotide biosynthesis protein B n=1 Tax=Metaclostridioides mangenotii TaxID=1540 RepID=UPI00057208BA|nr:molybdopterin-guanine dinucleotide biosynthesis protein B [Clostridioides mangenotii]
MYNILSITSYSGVGKTTLIEGVVKELTNLGLNIGCIKHTCHDFEIDRPNKDSMRYRNSGASSVSILSEKTFVFVEKTEQEKSLYDIINLYKNADLIIIEGFKGYKFKKIEITRSILYTKLISDTSDLIGIVSDVNYDIGVKQFKLGDYTSVAEHIKYCLDTKKLELSEEILKKIIYQ